MVAIGLMFTGAVLLVNGLAMLGAVDSRSGAVMNLFVGTLDVFIAVDAAVRGDTFLATKVFLFGFTYLWVAYNSLMRVTDGRAFGWYCAFVAALAFPTALITFDEGSGWFGVFWLTWAALWFLFFLILALGMERIVVMVGVLTIFLGVTTAMVPGYLMAAGRWSG